MTYEHLQTVSDLLERILDAADDVKQWIAPRYGQEVFTREDVSAVHDVAYRNLDVFEAIRQTPKKTGDLEFDLFMEELESEFTELQYSFNSWVQDNGANFFMNDDNWEDAKQIQAELEVLGSRQIGMN